MLKHSIKNTPNELYKHDTLSTLYYINTNVALLYSRFLYPRFYTQPTTKNDLK